MSSTVDIKSLDMRRLEEMGLERTSDRIFILYGVEQLKQQMF